MKKGQSPRHMRRANGTGSITKWEGKRRKPWIVRYKGKIIGSFSTESKAAAFLKNMADAGFPEERNETVEDVYKLWKAAHLPNVGDRCAESYETAWKHIVAAKVDKIRFAEIRTSHWQQAINKAEPLTGKKEGQTKPLSRSAKSKIMLLAGQLSQYAVQQDIVQKDYSKFVELEKVTKTSRPVFTDADIKKLVEDDSNTARIVLTLIYSGLRINELFGLLRENVNVKDGYFTGGEKTAAGRDRVIPIHPKIKAYVAEWYLKGGTYLITAAQGGMIDDHNFRTREYYPLLDSLGIERKVPHSTRHTFATKAAVADIRPEDITAMIGHAQYSTTADIYIHKEADKLKDAINQIT